MSDFTPTTEQVRSEYTIAYPPPWRRESVPERQYEFNRWLESVKREAAAVALEEAANWLINGEEAGIIAYEGPSNRAEVIAAYDRAIEDPACWLQERATTTRNPRTPGEETTP